MKKIVFFILVIGSLSILCQRSVLAVTCSPTESPAGTFTVSSDCSFSTTFPGVDYGTGIVNSAKIVVASGTLTLQPGFNIGTGSFVITDGASMAIANTGAVVLGVPLWGIDTDGDGKIGSAIISANDETANGRSRLAAWLATSNVDCNDADPAILDICCTADGSATACSANAGCCNNNCGTDADSDGHLKSSVNTGRCFSAATPKDDCCDTDGQAYPGSGSSSSGPRNICGGYDYNCNGVEEKNDETIGAAMQCENFDYENCLSADGIIGWVNSVPACGVQADLYSNIGVCQMPPAGGSCEATQSIDSAVQMCY